MYGVLAQSNRASLRIDYLGFSNASRASIRMTHEADGPTVSLSVATRYDQENSRRLLRERKLSLIVDLDQTIVHATVDPTVGEWMEDAERYLFEKAARQAKNDLQDLDEDVEMDSTTPPDPDLTLSADDVNPNWDALSDVKRFKLGEGQPGSTSKSQDDGCFYYIKPR